MGIEGRNGGMKDRRISDKGRREKSGNSSDRKIGRLEKEINSVLAPSAKRKSSKTRRGKVTKKAQGQPGKLAGSHRKERRKWKGRRKGRTTGSLTAGDLWSLNRSAGSFQELRDT